jgi:hypothetical protein
VRGIARRGAAAPAEVAEAQPGASCKVDPVSDLGGVRQSAMSLGTPVAELQGAPQEEIRLPRSQPPASEYCKKEELR